MPDPNNITIIKDNITFMCLPKCGNTSLKYALMSAWGFNTRAFNINHMLARYVAQGDSIRSTSKEWIYAQGENGERHLALAICRHPQARLASWIRDKAGNPMHVSAARARIGLKDDFNTIVNKVCATNDENCDQHYRSMFHELVLDDGTLVPNFTAKLEHIKRDWTIIRELVSIHTHGERDMGNKLPKLNAYDSLKEPIYFSQEQCDKIYNRYQKDFFLFGYGVKAGPF